MVVVERVQFLFSIFLDEFLFTLLLRVVVVSMSGLLLGCCSSSATTAAAAAAAPRRRRVMVRASRFPAPSMGGSFSSKPSSESSSESSFFKALLDPSSKRLATSSSSSSSSRFIRRRRRDDDDGFRVRATRELLGFDLNPAALGFICVMVVWVIPQTIGISKLDGNEKIARQKMAEWGIDTTTKDNNEDYIYQNNYGAVKERFKKECEKRGEKVEDYL